MTKYLHFYFKFIATSALMLSVVFSALAQIPDGYYDAANGLSGDQLKAALHTIIKGHTTYPYSSSGTDVWDILKEADRDPNNSSNVIGIYSNFSMDAAAEYAGGSGWNREHVWAKSRGDFGTSRGAGTDVHHLRACDISTNSARNNRNFGDGTTQYIDGSGNYQGATDSYTSSTEWVWEPRDEVKGDVARMIFYMATRYEGDGGDPDLELTETLLSNTDKSPLQARLSTLLIWHQNDPVSDAERDRNDIIYGYQNNRNPYIDHPEYVCAIYACAGGGNSAPVFSSTEITTATVDEAYNYSVTTTDVNGDAMDISATTLPSWLSFTDNGGGSATLSGTPSTGDIGNNDVVLSVSDGTESTTQSFAIVVSTTGGGGSSDELFFSEYIEGSSFNKGLEVANFTGASIDLSVYSIQKQTNGAGAWGSTLNLTGTLAEGDVWVVVHTNADASMVAEADLVTGSGSVNFNGNDPVGLFKNGELIDIIGEFNGGSSDFAKDVTLVRKPTITNPNTTFTQSEWESEAKDNFSFLGSHSINTQSCGIATGQAVSNITTFSAELSWAEVADATSYNIRFKPMSSSYSWEEIESETNGLILENFMANTEYEFQVQSVCSSIGTAAFSTSTNFTTLEEVIASINKGNKSSFDVQVFPNPSLNTLNIKVDTDLVLNFYVEMADFNGRIVFSKKAVVVEHDNIVKIDVAGFKNGSYILKVRSNSGEYCSQLVQINN